MRDHGLKSMLDTHYPGAVNCESVILFLHPKRGRSLLLRLLFLSSLAILPLVGCSTAMHGQSQEITIRTPGAEHATCYLDNGTVIRRVNTDETLNMTRSDKDLEVQCYASGNRTKKVTIERKISEETKWNVATGIVPGVAYDYLSRGAFVYPDQIVVDFTGMKPTTYPLPEYHSPNSPKPSSVHTEQIAAGHPILESDRGRTAPVLKKHDIDYLRSNNPFSTNVKDYSASTSPAE